MPLSVERPAPVSTTTLRLSLSHCASLCAAAGSSFSAGACSNPSRRPLSVAFGFAAIGKREHRFQMLVGFGTEPFDEGGQVKSVRFTVGVAP